MIRKIGAPLVRPRQYLIVGVCFVALGVLLNLVWFYLEYTSVFSGVPLTWMSPALYFGGIVILWMAGIQVKNTISNINIYKKLVICLWVATIFLCFLALLQLVCSVTCVGDGDRYLFGIVQGRGLIVAIDLHPTDHASAWSYEYIEGPNFGGSSEFSRFYRYGLHKGYPVSYLWLSCFPGVIYLGAVLALVKRKVFFLEGDWCPRCRYSIFGNTSGVCPECGVSIKNKSDVCE